MKNRRVALSWPKCFSLMLITLTCGVACQGSATTTYMKALSEEDKQQLVKASELHMVDCLLPGQIRVLGKMTYLSQRQPTRTTGADCQLRGGDYVAHDRANYRTALETWLPTASSGDPEAQHQVGMIYEKGLGVDPDYVEAAKWYQKAVDKDYKRSMFNLGYLYESGLGVAQDKIKATNLYLRATGSEVGSVILSSEASKMVSKVNQEAQQKMARFQSQKKALELQVAAYRNQVDELNKSLAASRATPDHAHQEQIKQIELEIANLSSVIAEVDSNEQAMRAELKPIAQVAKNISRFRGLGQNKRQSEQVQTYQHNQFGKYYALIIGNQDYEHLDNLSSPLNDVRRLEKILEEKYQFEIISLENAREESILVALNGLHQKIGPKDNLMIYFAGHGEVSENVKRGRGYWLPTDAEKQRILHWIPNSTINDHLDRIAARSILVIADSCYAGYMANKGSLSLMGNLYGHLDAASIKAGLSLRSRQVISSGGTMPVLDNVGGKHSIFAKALFEVLESKHGVFSDSHLHQAILANMHEQQRTNQSHQKPVIQSIRSAGHEGGSFYFVPKSDSYAAELLSPKG